MSKKKALKSFFELVDKYATWTCGDCGNTYDINTIVCPNEFLDKIAVVKRSIKSKDKSND